MQVIKAKNAKQMLSKPKVKKENQVPPVTQEKEFSTKFQTQVLDKANEQVRLKLKIEAQKAAARNRFYNYCKVLEPEYYKDSRQYLIDYCDTLQAMFEKRVYSLNVNDVEDMEQVVWHIAKTKEEVPEGAYICRKIIINMPPQHFKSRTLEHFVAWVLGKDNKQSFLSCSYNNDLAETFSRYIRDEILQPKITDELIYSDIFPERKIKDDNRSVGLWAVEGSHFSYRASGMCATITGTAGTIRIIDDPIKDDQVSEEEREKQWNWYVATFLSRKDAREKEPLDILNMTRWFDNDLTAKILDNYLGKFYYHLCMPAYNEKTDTMLCEEVYSKESYMNKLKACEGNELLEALIIANYQQVTYKLKGALFESGFKEYSQMPMDSNGRVLSYGRKAYVDVADRGKDYTCAGAYNEYQGEAYIYDIFFSPERQEITAPQLADWIIRNEINYITFESNNGGETYGREVYKILKNKGWRRTAFEYKFTKENKEAKIFSNAPLALQVINFPINWKTKWKSFAKQLLTYQKDQSGRNKAKHDDAPDMIIGITMNLNPNNQSCVVSARY